MASNGCGHFPCKVSATLKRIWKMTYLNNVHYMLVLESGNITRHQCSDLKYLPNVLMLFCPLYD